MTDLIDRIAPTRRPDRRAVMYQKWRSLTFLHWALPPEQVRALLPEGLELDTFGGNAYVGLVPFTMRGIRPVGLPAVPWLSNFHETNVRTYVHVRGRDPGVYFFSLDAANPVAVALARYLFHLPYHHAAMTLESENRPGPVGESCRYVRYESVRDRPGREAATARITCRLSPASPTQALFGTLDHFLIERYILYTSHRGRLHSGQVHHSSYPIQSAEVIELEENLIAAAGLSRPDSPPLVHFATGVDVEIFLLRVLANL